MSYKTLSDEEKLILIEKLNWDYDISAKEILDVITGKKYSAGAFTRETLFARSLETFLWEDLVNLWGLETCKTLYTEKTRRMIFSKSLREEYDAVFSVLRGNPLPISRQSSESLAKMRASLLFNRRNRCEQRVFKSPLLRRP